LVDDLRRDILAALRERRGIRGPVRYSGRWPRGGGTERRDALFPPEVDEHPPRVVRILLHSVVNDLDVLTVKKAKYPLSQLSRALSGDDLDERCLLGNGLVHDRAKRAIEFVTAVIDVVQVKLELHQAIVVLQSDERESWSAHGTLPTARTGGRFHRFVSAVMCSNGPAWMRVRPFAHGSFSSSTSRAATVAEAIEGCADQFQEQAFLVPIRELSGANPY